MKVSELVSQKIGNMITNYQTWGGILYNVKAYGAAGDGVTDDTAAFNAALAAGLNVFVPEGVYVIAGTINVARNGQKFRGAGSRATQLIASTANLPLINIGAGKNWIEVSDMTLDRSVAATAGGTGLISPGIVSNVILRDLYIQNQYNGMILTGTDWSYVEKVTIIKCYSNGIYMANLPAFPACQWQFDTVLISQCDGSGIAVRSVVGTTTMPMGKMTKISTFANSGYGIQIIAVSTCPIYGVRISGSFLGADGLGELYMDTYGGQHTITDVFTEQAGTQITGRLQTTAASNVGSGFEFTANNADILISGCYGSAHSFCGIRTEASYTTINGCTMYSNGIAAIAPYQAGIGIYGGAGKHATVNGCLLNGNTAYGMYCVDGQRVILVANRILLNTTSPIFILANPTYINAIGNTPALTIGTVIPSGGLLVGAAATGGVPADGTINVSIDIKKNNTAYTNP